jgi:GH15 family glucan-1,4-alpha-glucosidase
MASRIEDYAMVGDGETAALIGRDGSLDWLCWPRFDSAACFAALLGGPEHGRWQLRPRTEARRVIRRYRRDTLVLETDIETEEGKVTLIDFMPPRGSASDLVRIVRGVQGRVSMCTEIIIRFDYGAVVPWVTQAHGSQTELCAIAGPDMLMLRTAVPLHGEEARTVGDFHVAAGETVAFVLTYTASHLPPPAAIDVEAAVRDTLEFCLDGTGRRHVGNVWTTSALHALEGHGVGSVGSCDQGRGEA